MGLKICMNECCRTKSSEWNKGWTLKSGESASLCYNCGSYNENFMFCETFHQEETGWRECRLCGKFTSSAHAIHCGCIAFMVLHQYLDFGGVACTSCPKRLDPKSGLSAVQISCVSNDDPTRVIHSSATSEETRSQCSTKPEILLNICDLLCFCVLHDVHREQHSRD